MKTNKEFLKSMFLKNKARFFGVFLLLLTILLVIFFWSFDLNLLKTQILEESQPMGDKEELELMKVKGCVFDGLLTGFGGAFENKIKMLSRSNCRYLHRAVETWNNPPNFDAIAGNINLIHSRTDKKFNYGFFIAESISTVSDYYYSNEGRNFDFNSMCVGGTQGHWGENTCKPSFASTEYRKYLKYITEKALEIGITDFTFGQIYYQDPNWSARPLAPQILEMMRDIAKSKGKKITIGAQTNNIEDKGYLRNFDYITGGIGQHHDGYIENGPCWSTFWDKYDYCWAMMWHSDFKSKANNVFVYLDWNNESSDDMNRYARMSRTQRHNFLGKAYDFFLWRDVGFLFPLGAVLDGSGAGCYGPDPIFYSANNSYSCRDEDAINQILNGDNFLPYYSKFIYQEVPLTMEVGRNYEIEIGMENTGMGKWREADDIELRLDETADDVWNVEEVPLDGGAEIKSREIKEFVFTVNAPIRAGAYSFKWRMFQKEQGFFGQSTQNIKVRVVEAID